MVHKKRLVRILFITSILKRCGVFFVASFDFTDQRPATTSCHCAILLRGANVIVSIAAKCNGPVHVAYAYALID